MWYFSGKYGKRLHELFWFVKQFYSIDDYTCGVNGKVSNLGVAKCIVEYFTDLA